MLGYWTRRLPVVILVFAVAGAAAAGEIYSTMRNVNAVVEAGGYRLIPISDIQPTALPSDLSPAQAFEIVRPMDRPVTIGRLFTSCSCIQLEAAKRTFVPGERAILILRNTRPTPASGQVYAVFVQVTSPVRATLRVDTFVQSGSESSVAGAGAGGSGAEPKIETPAVAAHLRIGRQAGGPAVLVDDEINRLGADGELEEEEKDTEEVAAADDPDTEPLDIPGLTDSPAGQSGLGDLPQLTGVPEGQRPARSTHGTADLVEGLEDPNEGFFAAMDAALPPAASDSEEGQEEVPPLALPDGADVRDGLGVAREDLEDSHDQPAGNAELTANVDAARQSMDSYFSQGQEARDSGSADLAVASDIGGEIPDFYAHVPASPPAPAVVPAPETQAAPSAMEEAASAGAPAQPAGTNGIPDLNPAAPATRQPDAAPAAGQADGLGSSAAAPAQPATSAAAQMPQRDPATRKPVQAVSLITVGVRDMQNSIRFYEALGWRRAAPNKYDQTAFFQLQGQILALYPMKDQLREQNMPEASPEPGGITLALHVQDKADVWAVYQRFVDAGGASLRPPAEMASGAVTSYVADPDGNPWEISWVPQFRIDEDGGLWLP